MEFTPAELAEATQLTPDLPIWKLSMDGVANAQGSGVGLILTSQTGYTWNTPSDSASKTLIMRHNMRRS